MTIEINYRVIDERDLLFQQVRRLERIDRKQKMQASF